VLLPLTGRNASVGQQVRDGLLSAYYGDDTPDRVTLRFYDTGAQSIAQALGAANAAGASFVIGPLTRDEVNAAADAAPRLPVLALNFLTTEHAAPPRFRQFGLSPEDEARAVAKRVLADGRRRGIVFAPAGEWSERVVRVFEEEFTAGGGNLLDVQYLTGTKETAAAIQAALRIDDQQGAARPTSKNSRYHARIPTATPRRSRLSVHARAVDVRATIAATTTNFLRRRHSGLRDRRCIRPCRGRTNRPRRRIAARHALDRATRRCGLRSAT
jgi:outer membrane PBP1 activator LpoA protein